MSDIHKILADLVMKTPLYGESARTAIKTAAEQIKELPNTKLQEARQIFNENYLLLSDNMEIQLQQQRERVEKMETAMKNALTRMLGGTMIEVKEILETALAELEATDDN